MLSFMNVYKLQWIEKNAIRCISDSNSIEKLCCYKICSRLLHFKLPPLWYERLDAAYNNDINTVIACTVSLHIELKFIVFQCLIHELLQSSINFHVEGFNELTEQHPLMKIVINQRLIIRWPKNQLMPKYLIQILKAKHYFQN